MNRSAGSASFNLCVDFAVLQIAAPRSTLMLSIALRRYHR